MNRACRAVLVVAAAAATARAGTEQLTNSAGDTSVERVGPRGTGLVTLSSTGDLVPGGAGNADGSAEVYLFDIAGGGVRQLTASAAGSSSARITAEGRVVLASRGDLTPGGPGNADGSFESWLFTPPTATTPSALEQLTSSVEDTFFQTYWDDGRRAFFVSKGDLTPGAPGNLDGQNEVFVYDVATKTLSQLTNSPRASLIRAICAPERCGVIESAADLTPGVPGNADGSTEIFLLDLDTLAVEQVTASAANTGYRGQDAKGRHLAFESRGDVVAGGNTDGSREVFVYDRKSKTLHQATSSAGDSSFRGFVPKKTIAVVESKTDLVAGGNADGSTEIFTVDFVKRRTVQHTSSTSDAFFGGFANARNGRAAIVSSGDLDGGGVPIGANQVFLQKLGKKRKHARRLTDGSFDSYPAGFDRKGRYLVIGSRSDLVPGGNADNSDEVFVARTKGKPKLRQLTSSPLASEFAGFSDDGRTILVNSSGDLAPGAPGNADGSVEVFRIGYR
jgi:Tol biopolymer transport system component